MKAPSRFIRSTLLIVLLLGLPSLVSAQGNVQKIKEKIENINDILTKATLSGDHETILKYYTNDAILAPSFHPMIKGIEAIKERYKKDKEKGLKYHSFTGTIDHLWAHGNEVYERGTFGLAVSSNHSHKPSAFFGSYFQIWEKQSNGSYKIKYVIWNLDFNPFEH